MNMIWVRGVYVRTPPVRSSPKNNSIGMWANILEMSYIVKSVKALYKCETYKSFIN